MKKLFSIFLLINLFNCNKKIDSDTNIFYDKAFEFLEKKNKDSAYVYFDKAKDIFVEKNNNAKAGKCLVNMAIISTDKGDYYGGQSISIEASKFFDENDKQQFADICSNYNNLGIASNNLKDYKNAIRFYYEAIKFTDDTPYKLIALNNIGNAYKEQKKYNPAIKIYEEILKEAKNPKTYSTVITNLATTKWQSNPFYNPEKELLKALQIRESQNDLWGQNSSHSHLADFFMNKNSEKALFHSKKMLELSKLNKSADDQAEALKKLINLDADKRLYYFKVYQSLSDSLQTARNNSKNQFALIRFDSEKLKTENAQNQNQILKQYFLVALLALALIIIIVWYRRRQKRLKQENELKIKNNQLKLSKKVHDVVANGIYQVITKIENQENIDKNEMLDELEFVYEKSRDISYEKIDLKEDEEDFGKKISKLIATFKNETVNTYVAGNDETIWKDLKSSGQEEVYQIIRELLVNMKKHSQADRVVLKFERINNFITIHYTDNGVGISGELIYKNGLTSTVSRIENVRGEIIFDTEIEKGLKITISFPI
ncbi:tetratricopeptide repeat-containing sensor histidine kinase [Chryseobacterium limigenitum]|nr:tetratricopeptide repeat-containing sensor histidine kinase [Chryseobacterium limigenitum]